MNGTYVTPELNETNYSQVIFDVTSLHVVNEFYQCNCKNFHITGYLCSHVLVALNENKLISLKTLCGQVTVNKSKGRRRNRGKALTRDIVEEISHPDDVIPSYLGAAVRFKDYGSYHRILE